MVRSRRVCDKAARACKPRAGCAHRQAAFGSGEVGLGRLLGDFKRGNLRGGTSCIKVGFAGGQPDVGKGGVGIYGGVEGLPGRCGLRWPKSNRRGHLHRGGLQAGVVAVGVVVIVGQVGTDGRKRFALRIQQQRRLGTLACARGLGLRGTAQRGVERGDEGQRRRGQGRRTGRSRDGYRHSQQRVAAMPQRVNKRADGMAHSQKKRWAIVTGWRQGGRRL